jgi:hypothetical protein
MNKHQDSGIRALDDSELDFVVGGVIDGCIPTKTIGTINPLPPTTPWFDDFWIQVGKTGTLPR